MIEDDESEDKHMTSNRVDIDGSSSASSRVRCLEHFVRGLVVKISVVTSSLIFALHRYMRRARACSSTKNESCCGTSKYRGFLFAIVVPVFHDGVITRSFEYRWFC